MAKSGPRRPPGRGGIAGSNPAPASKGINGSKGRILRPSSNFPYRSLQLSVDLSSVNPLDDR